MILIRTSLPLLIGLALATAACDKKEEPKPVPATPSAPPSPAATASAPASAAPSTADKPAGDKKEKGGGEDGAKEAKEAKQKAGAKALAAKDKGKKQGDKVEGLACDAATEGVGFCESDEDLVFCAGGAWWTLECSAVAPKSSCGYDEKTLAVDCWEESQLTADDEDDDDLDKELDDDKE